MILLSKFLMCLSGYFVTERSLPVWLCTRVALPWAQSSYELSFSTVESVLNDLSFCLGFYIKPATSKSHRNLKSSV